jgi:hypothetical protein
MAIRVVYNDNICDTIPFYILQMGIECNRIRLFYRESEKKWVTVGTDPVRKLSSKKGYYEGPERRLRGYTTAYNI